MRCRAVELENIMSLVGNFDAGVNALSVVTRPVAEAAAYCNAATAGADSMLAIGAMIVLLALLWALIEACRPVVVVLRAAAATFAAFLLLVAAFVLVALTLYA
jgi:hypothetical protein